MKEDEIWRKRRVKMKYEGRGEERWRKRKGKRKEKIFGMKAEWGNSRVFKIGEVVYPVHDFLHARHVSAPSAPYVHPWTLRLTGLLTVDSLYGSRVRGTWLPPYAAKCASCTGVVYRVHDSSQKTWAGSTTPLGYRKPGPRHQIDLWKSCTPYTTSVTYFLKYFPNYPIFENTFPKDIIFKKNPLLTNVILQFLLCFATY